MAAASGTAAPGTVEEAAGAVEVTLVGGAADTDVSAPGWFAAAGALAAGRAGRCVLRSGRTIGGVLAAAGLCPAAAAGRGGLPAADAGAGPALRRAAAPSALSGAAVAALRTAAAAVLVARLRSRTRDEATALWFCAAPGAVTRLPTGRAASRVIGEGVSGAVRRAGAT